MVNFNCQFDRRLYFLGDGSIYDHDYEVLCNYVGWGGMIFPLWVAEVPLPGPPRLYEMEK